MIPLLDQILCVVEKMAAAIVSLLVIMVNGAIIGLGAMLGVVVALLPDMPAPPSPPSEGVLAWINFVVPLGPLAALVLTLSALFAAFLGVRIMLNWLRAL